MRMKTGAVLLSLCLGGVSLQALAGDLDVRLDQSRGTVKAFFTELKGELVAGMKAGGPANAISVCNVKAPGIAEKHSRNNGWDVGRTSLKFRNPNNAPDAWEKAVLEKFEQRKAAGEDLAKMEYYEVVESDGKKSFRYMKAIPTGEVCLKCHGSNIAAPVVQRLDELYPGDKARGYSLGDIRGAFTITQPM